MFNFLHWSLYSTVWFVVTLDLKALYELLVKDDDETFELGGNGLDVEFCFICKAIRVRLFNNHYKLIN